MINDILSKGIFYWKQRSRGGCNQGMPGVRGTVIFLLLFFLETHFFLLDTSYLVSPILSSEALATGTWCTSFSL